jgi:tRNA-dihydrouridine synthase C
MPGVAAYWLGVRQRVLPAHAGGRLKQWLALLRRNYAPAADLYQRLRPVKTTAEIDRLLVEAGVLRVLPASHLELADAPAQGVREA